MVLGFYHAPTTLFHQCLLDRYFRKLIDRENEPYDRLFPAERWHYKLNRSGLFAFHYSCHHPHLWAVCLFIASLAATLTSKAIDGCGTDPTTSQLHRARHFWFGCTVPAGRSFSFPSLFIHTLRCVLSLPRVPACFTLVPLSSSQLVAR